ncbi:MAG: DEAD/DEAH box helicase [Desulfocapsaceae bacterium]|nr:DEAD/DEAH box helicase [Desulfocapsaceae bacterium]
MIKTMLLSAQRRIRNLLGRKKHSAPPLPPAQPLEAPAADKAAAGADGPEKAGRKGSDGRREGTSARRRQKRKDDWDISKFQVEPVQGKLRFHDFALPDVIMHAIADLKFEYCSPVQALALPAALEGKDLIGRANTGTGKSAVFLISLFSRLLADEAADAGNGRPRALIIAPTRELVVQIAQDGRDLAKYTPLRIVPVFGGTDYRNQMQELQGKRCDVVVATPGRLLDYLGKNVLRLDDCRIMVIDEADRMLDMGFIPDVRRIINRTPEKRQTMLFSATLTEEVCRLASQWCIEPVQVEIEQETVTAATVDQIVYLVTTAEKYDVLYNLIMKKAGERILVFTNQKNEASRLNDRLKRCGINCSLLTGDVPQQQRSNRLENFRGGNIQVLVATDVAGRGIHVDDISHVVNYTLPYEPEDYVHRIGRTGRAGAAGTSVSFACEEGSFYLPQIEEYIGRKLECIVPDEDLLIPAPKGMKAEGQPEIKRDGQKRRRRPGGGGRETAHRRR